MITQLMACEALIGLFWIYPKPLQIKNSPTETGRAVCMNGRDMSRPYLLAVIYFCAITAPNVTQALQVLFGRIIA
jgi:hypothetical protein